ncbi:MAG: Hpt domain-containing protein [Ruthenibacterium sp.]
MSRLLENLRLYGADVSGALERFVDDEQLYADCLRLFMADDCFASLQSALECGDESAAFESAHTLKGVAGNLGLTPLYQSLCTLVEVLRRRDGGDVRALCAAVLQEKSRVEALLA